MIFRFLRLLSDVLGRVTILEHKVDHLMTIQDDLVAAVKAEKDEAKAAVTALNALETEVADLKAKAASGVDPAVLTQAIADLGSSTTELAAAIPAPDPTPAPAAAAPAPAAPAAPAPAA